MSGVCFSNYGTQWPFGDKVKIKEQLKWGIMKIVDYLIIVSTWLLSSYTFSFSDVNFKRIKEHKGAYQIQFGVIGSIDAQPVQMESILNSMPFVQVKEVVKRKGEFSIKIEMKKLPSFREFRSVFTKYGFEMDARFFIFPTKELQQKVEQNIHKIKLQN